MKEYDIVIIGAGSGGYVAAIRGAQLGAKVAVIEKDTVGGTCLNRGCIPTKTLVESANRLRNIKNSSAFGINVNDYNFDFNKMMKNKDTIIKKLTNGISFLLRKHKIDLIKGTGKIVKNGLVEVKREDNIEQIRSNNIIIATGSKPLVFSNFNYDGERVITSNEALNLTELPKSMLIIGSGVIGCEFASIFSELGCQITMIDIAENILPTESRTISKHLTKAFKKQGIEIKTQTTIKEIVVKENDIVAYTDKNEVIMAEKALICIGRKMVNKNLGINDLGIEMDEKGGIITNKRMETNIKGIYAIGDITNKIQLAHVAFEQGKTAVENIMGGDAIMDYNVVPSCIFTNPEIASVGMDLDDAKAAECEVLKGSSTYNKSGKAMAMGLDVGVVEIIVDKNTDKVMGAQIIGEHASDLISEISVMIKNNLSAKQLIKTIHPHPTLSEIVMEAAESIYDISIHE